MRLAEDIQAVEAPLKAFEQLDDDRDADVEIQKLGRKVLCHTSHLQ